MGLPADAARFKLSLSRISNSLRLQPNQRRQVTRERSPGTKTAS